MWLKAVLLENGKFHKIEVKKLPNNGLLGSTQGHNVYTCVTKGFKLYPNKDLTFSRKTPLNRIYCGFTKFYQLNRILSKKAPTKQDKNLKKLGKKQPFFLKLGTL